MRTARRVVPGPFGGSLLDPDGAIRPPVAHRQMPGARCVTGFAVGLLLAWFVVGRVATGSALALGSNLVQFGVAVLATVAAFLRVQVTRSGRRHLRLLVAAAGSWALGQLYWTIAQVVEPHELPSPSPADVGFVASYLFLIGAFLALPSSVRRRRLARQILDGLTVMIAVLTSAWALWLRAVFADAGGSLESLLVGAVYPGLGVLTVGAAAFVASRAIGRWQSPVVLALVGSIFLALADSGLAIEQGVGYVAGGLTDLGWVLGWLAFALAATAAWHDRSAVGVPRLLGDPTWLPAASLTVALIVLAVSEVQRDAISTDTTLFVLAVATFGLSIARSLAFQIESAGLTGELAAQVGEALERAERYEDALDAAGAGTWEWDVATGVVRYSKGVEQRFFPEAQSSEVSVPQFLAAISDGDKENVIDAFRTAMERGEQVEIEYSRNMDDGSTIQVEARGHARRNARGDVILTGVAIDVTERRSTRDLLTARARQSAELAEFGRRTLSSHDPQSVFWDAVATVATALDVDSCRVHRLDPASRVLDVVASLGAAGPGVSGVDHDAQARYSVSTGSTIVTPDLSAEKRFAVPPPGTAGRDGSGLSVPIRTETGIWGVLEASSRRARPSSENDVHFVEAIANVIGEDLDRERLQQQLRHHAVHDQLTGLPNRTLLMDRVARLLEDREPTQPVGVLHVGVDHFGRVNDSLGHDAGDLVLVEIGRRLTTLCPRGGTIARHGGDEFVIAGRIADPADAAALADRALQRVAEPVVLDDHEIYLTASVGVAIADQGMAADQLLLDAFTASRRAAERGGGQIEVFDGITRTRAIERMQAESEIRRGLADGQFEPWYQPVVRLSDRVVVGAEALARWRHPDRGIVEPGAFIEVAEHSGLIVPLGDAIMARALQDAAGWPSSAAAPMTVSINLAVAQVAGFGVVETVAREIDRSGIDPSRICLEVVEGAIGQADTASIADTLTRLRALGGVRVHIDDFGTGHSSLSRLHELPVDAVKIDRSFIARVDREADRALVGAIIEMGRVLGLTVIAEGIETEAQLRIVQDLGCEYGQGWLFAKAMPATEFALVAGATIGMALAD